MFMVRVGHYMVSQNTVFNTCCGQSKLSTDKDCQQTVNDKIQLLTTTGRKDETSCDLNNDSYKPKPCFPSNLSGPRKSEPFLLSENLTENKKSSSFLHKKSSELKDMDHQKANNDECRKPTLLEESTYGKSTDLSSSQKTRKTKEEPQDLDLNSLSPEDLMLHKNTFYQSSIPYSSSKPSSNGDKNTKLLDYCRPPHNELAKSKDQGSKTKESISSRRADSIGNSKLGSEHQETADREYSQRRTQGNARSNSSSKSKNNSSGTARLAQCPLCGRQFAK